MLDIIVGFLSALAQSTTATILLVLVCITILESGLVGRMDAKINGVKVRED